MDPQNMENNSLCDRKDETELLQSHEVSANEMIEDGKKNGDTEAEEKRGTWTAKSDYIMTMVGYCVGVGNIWRFPYLCHKYGGGAFLLSYLLMLFVGGVPLFMLESSMGQFSSQAGITIYSICPALMGAGVTSIIINIIIHISYSVLVTYPLIFLYYSLASKVPWAFCDNAWNTPDCHLVDSWNLTNFDESQQLVSSAEEFFQRKVLNISGGIGESREMVWHLMGANAIVWIIVFITLFKGIKVSGKVVWFTATFPVLMLLVLLIRSVTLPGAIDGLYYYVYPDFEKLKNGEVWAAAASQIIVSLGPGWSAIFTMSSYNKFENNCLKDAIIIPVMNSSASILAGFVVFSVLGFMANEMGTTVDTVMASGPALAFVTYPEALALMPLAPFWAVLFFLMFFFVGLDSLFVTIEVTIVSILDCFPGLRKWRSFVTMVTCIAMFLMALNCCTQDGMHVLQLMDWSSIHFSPQCVCLIEIIIFSFLYGAGTVVRDIKMMTNKKVNYFWYISLLIVTPIVLMVICVNQLTSFNPTSHMGVILPNWAQGISWTLALAPVSAIPVYMVIYICRSKGSFRQRVTEGFRPSSAWGPALASNRRDWEDYCRNNPLRHRLLHPDLFLSSSHQSSGLEMEPLSTLSQ